MALAFLYRDIGRVAQGIRIRQAGADRYAAHALMIVERCWLACKSPAQPLLGPCIQNQCGEALPTFEIDAASFR